MRKIGSKNNIRKTGFWACIFLYKLTKFIPYFFPSFFCCHFQTVTSNGDPRNTDEYVPAMIPIINASEKC